jgi:hypothetical protein
MSLIKKADVKNHLSTRHRTEIHLCRLETEPGTEIVVEDESVGTAPEIGDPTNASLNRPTPCDPETAPTVTPSGGPSPVVVSAQVKSAKA